MPSFVYGSSPETCFSMYLAGRRSAEAGRWSMYAGRLKHARRARTAAVGRTEWDRVFAKRFSLHRVEALRHDTVQLT